MLKTLRRGSSSDNKAFQPAGAAKPAAKGYKPTFHVMITNGEELGFDFSGVETELEGKLLDKPLHDAVIEPFLKNLKAHLKSRPFGLASIEVNGASLPLYSAKGEGTNRSAADFATEACADGWFRPCVIKLEVCNAKDAKALTKQTKREAQSHTFRVTIGSITAEATVEGRWLERPVKRAIVAPFLKAHNQKAGAKCTLADVVGLTVGSLEGSDGPPEEVTGLGDVVRALESPASKLAREGGRTLVKLHVRDGSNASSPGIRRSKSINIGEVAFSTMLTDGDEEAESDDPSPEYIVDWKYA